MPNISCICTVHLCPSTPNNFNLFLCIFADSGRGIALLFISVVVVQLALLTGLYIQNLQLSGEVGEFKAKAETFRCKSNMLKIITTLETYTEWAWKTLRVLKVSVLLKPQCFCVLTYSPPIHRPPNSNETATQQ